MEKTFHEKLKDKIDEFVHCVYRISRSFPREELYGITSQLRRAALSIILNYIEGYARTRDRVHIQFLEISYGSLKECKYLLLFALKEGYCGEKEYQIASDMADEIGAMLWKTIENLKRR